MMNLKIYLHKIYRLVDLEDIVTKKLESQRQRFQETQQHLPSTYDSRINSIHLSEPEWKEFSKGREVLSKDVWPIVFHELGIKMQKKPDGWGEEKKDEEEDPEL